MNAWLEKYKASLRGISAGRTMSALLGAVLLFASPAWADCLGEYRETTAAEKAAWGYVSSAFSPLVMVPQGYALKEENLAVSRDGRCTDGENDPIYLPVHLHFELQGERLQQLQQEIQRAEAPIMAVLRKYQPRFSSLLSELEQLAASYPPSPQDRKAMDRIDREVEELKQRQKEETAPLEVERQRVYARLEISVDAYFNDRTSDCKGESVVIPAATACLEHFEDGKAHLTALLGAWRKGEDGWLAAFDSGKPSHALQTLEISVSAADGMDMANMLDWRAAAALLDGAEK